jgi:hypothetical protein
MSFEARLYIQGVAVFVPDEKEPESKMSVLFPNQEKAAEMGIRDSKGKPICRHHAVLQFDSRSLDSEPPHLFQGKSPKGWTTIDLSGLWLRFTAEPTLAPRLMTNGRVPGVPLLPEVLREHIPLTAAGAPSPPLDLSILPQASVGGTDLLKAGLILDAGVLSPYAEFEGFYSFLDSSEKGSNSAGKGHKKRYGYRPTQYDHKLSSVLKLEFGQVESFTLHFKPFGAETDSFDLPLHPPTDPGGERWDELEIWVRHFCDLSRPDLEGKTAEPGEKDADFALNYMLLKDFNGVLETLGNVLPVPSISSSWGRGGLIGSVARKCMPAQVKTFP